MQAYKLNQVMTNEPNEYAEDREMLELFWKLLESKF